MKKAVNLLVLSLVLLLALESCTSKPDFNPKEGKVYIEIGEFKDSVAFKNTKTDLKTEEQITSIVNDVCIEAKALCKYGATFKPSFCEIQDGKTDDYSEDQDDRVHISFIANNAYNTPVESLCGGYLKNNKVVDVIGLD